MSKIAELFRQGEFDELWERCCGFIDLSLEDFMKIQRRLTEEQLVLMAKSALGQHVMGDARPTNVEELRHSVPLTTYADYAPFLTKRRMDVLPKKPILWQYTSGKTGEYAHRWVPVTSRQLDEIEPLIWAMLLFASCKGRKDVAFNRGDKVLYGMAPPPYVTGTMTRVFPSEVFNFLPPIAEAESTPFEERIKAGFEMGLSQGMDICFAMSSVAVAIGNRFSSSGGHGKLPRHPLALLRLARGLLKSRLARRRLLPRDLWTLKGLITFGIDSSIFRDKIKEMWGRYPLEIHGCTEAVLVAMQTWDNQGMTFIPHLNLFEFIPEAEAIRSWQDPTYQPQTYLMDELKPGNYELVITSFHGGPFLRYRLGHLVRITALRNETLGIDIPQMVFLSRIDDQIDIAGFTRLSEKVIWQAVENCGCDYVDWVARRETIGDAPSLHLYIEPGRKGADAGRITTNIHRELSNLDKGYADLEAFTGLNPLRVTLLPRGAFAHYRAQRAAAGADMASLKPPHINPTEATLDILSAPVEEKKVLVKT